MESSPFPDLGAAVQDRGAPCTAPDIHDCWIGLSRDVIERFMDVTGCTRKVTPAERCGCRADLYALETWMQHTTGHTVLTASTAELWAYFRKALAAGPDPKLLDRLMASMQHFYAYAREAGFRDDDPTVCMPKWIHEYLVPAAGSRHAVHANG
jgi:site-specific recombinase XerD